MWVSFYPHCYCHVSLHFFPLMIVPIFSCCFLLNADIISFGITVILAFLWLLDPTAIAQAVVAALQSAVPRMFNAFSPLLSTGAGTPVVEEAHVGQLQPPIPPVDLTTYAAYELNKRRQCTRDYYQEAKRGIFENNSDTDRLAFDVHKSKDNIWVRECSSNAVVFRCSKTGVGPRNFMLELHGSRYRVADWLRKRRNGEFHNMDYEGNVSP